MTTPIQDLLTGSCPQNLGDAKNTSISLIKEISPENQEKLKEIGINTFLDLAICDPSAVSLKVGIARYIIEKYAAIAKLVLEEIEGDEKRSKKILLCGLDNAGKTTMLRALTECAGHPEYLKVLSDCYKPTLGSGIVQTKLFNVLDCIIWDLGGHKQFRDFWLNRDSGHISNTDLMVFMIDSQDSSRYEEAKEYLSGLLDKMQEMKLNPALFIVFSKVDPDQILQLEGSICELRANMEDKIHTYHTKWGRSTIYNLVSIFRHFSKVARPILPGLVLLDNKVKEIGTSLPVRGIVVQDDVGFVLAHYEREDGSTNDMIDYVIKMGYKIRHPEIESEIKLPIDSNNVYKILEHQLVLNKKFRFFITVKITKESNDSIMNEIVPEVEKWLKYTQ